VAATYDIDLTGCEIVDAPHSHAAAETAVAMIRAGRGELLMKVSLHTDELMHAVADRLTGSGKNDIGWAIRLSRLRVTLFS
jgi:phosphate acetyltransferase